MEQAQVEFLDDVSYDISEYLITGHAMSQYSNKCNPGLSLIELTQTMRDKMKSVRKVDLDKKKRKDRLAYMDADENIFITEKDKVITVFPNQRIFVAKTMYSNKKTGKKYL